MDPILLADFTSPSLPGSERMLVEKVVQAVADRLRGEALERMKTAVAEALMNAIEHGNRGQVDQPVRVQVSEVPGAVTVSVTDYGSSQPIPEPTRPDINAMLAGQAQPRGWGLFLIRNMTDELRVINGSDFHTLELVFYMENAGNEYKIS